MTLLLICTFILKVGTETTISTILTHLKPKRSIRLFMVPRRPGEMKCTGVHKVRLGQGPYPDEVLSRDPTVPLAWRSTDLHHHHLGG